MFEYKTIKKVIVALAVLFGADLAVLVLTLGKLSNFTLIALLILLITGIYFTTLSLKLLKELREMDQTDKK